MSEVKLKTVQLAVGVDLIGAKTSLQASKNMELTAMALGVIAVSKGSGRSVLIPWTNVKGCELTPVPKDTTQPGVAEQAQQVQPKKSK